MESGQELLDKLMTYIIDPALRVLFTLGLLVFIVGIVEFLWGVKEGKASPEGKSHLVYGLVGMLIMVSVYGIISIIIDTFGLDVASTDPSRIDATMIGTPFEN